ncbi:MAG: hypothetical protein ACP5UB_06035 [Candidatus Sumerlaeaceae bacterium]
MLRNALLLAISLMATIPALAEDYEVIVESGQGGQNVEWFSTIEGNWMESSSKSKAPGLTASKAMFKTAGPAGAARFTPDIPVEGEYEVFATYPDSGNAVGVIYHVHSASGDSEVVIDQRGRDQRAKPLANTWFSLGKFKFAKGKEGYVEIRDPQTGKAANEKEPNVRIYADAVKFVPVGFALPPQFAARKGSGAFAQSSLAYLPATPVAQSSQPTPSSPASATMPPLGQGSVPPVSSAPAVQSLPSLASATTNQSAAASLPGLASAAQPGSSRSTSAGAGQPPSLPALGSAAPSATAPSLPTLGSELTPAPGSAPVPRQQASPSIETFTATSNRMPVLPEIGSSASPMLAQAGSGTQAPNLPQLGALPPAVALPPSPPENPGMPQLQPLGQVAPAGQLSAPLSALQASLPSMPAGSPTLAPAGVQQPTAQAPPASDGLPWVYDEGTAHSIARSQNKKVLVFFVADGNRDVERYEKEYFSHPAVREELAKFVLQRVNFPLNTKAAYKVKVYGAGTIAVTDSFGERIGGISKIPSSPEDLAKELRELASK